jgi:hypothetical protein
MKLELLAKAVASAREQAGSLTSKADQLAQEALTAKARARKAKTELKLARQEARQARKASPKSKVTKVDTHAKRGVAKRRPTVPSEGLAAGGTPGATAANVRVE